MGAPLLLTAFALGFAAAKLEVSSLLSTYLGEMMQLSRSQAVHLAGAVLGLMGAYIVLFCIPLVRAARRERSEFWARTLYEDESISGRRSFTLKDSLYLSRDSYNYRFLDKNKAAEHLSKLANVTATEDVLFLDD